jgi:hypothetical protein
VERHDSLRPTFTFFPRQRRQSNYDHDSWIYGCDRKMNNHERNYLGRVKELSCGNCGVDGPSSAHHILSDAGRRLGHYATIPLCWDCHQSPQGIHGDKTLWHIMKNDEDKVWEDTIRRLNET